MPAAAWAASAWSARSALRVRKNSACGTAPVAHQGREDARRAAVPDQHAAGALERAIAREQPELEAIGAGEPPGGGDQPMDEQRLQRALGAKLLEQRALERLELGAAVVRQQDVLFGREAVLQGVLRRARLALGGPRPARFGAVGAARLSAGAAVAKGGAGAPPAWLDMADLPDLDAGGTGAGGLGRAPRNVPV